MVGAAEKWLQGPRRYCADVSPPAALAVARFLCEAARAATAWRPTPSRARGCGRYPNIDIVLLSPRRSVSGEQYFSSAEQYFSSAEPAPGILASALKILFSTHRVENNPEPLHGVLAGCAVARVAAAPVVECAGLGAGIPAPRWAPLHRHSHHGEFVRVSLSRHSPPPCPASGPKELRPVLRRDRKSSALSCVGTERAPPSLRLTGDHTTARRQANPARADVRVGADARAQVGPPRQRDEGGHPRPPANARCIAGHRSVPLPAPLREGGRGGGRAPGPDRQGVQ
jgi:hypothetical protein